MKLITVISNNKNTYLFYEKNNEWFIKVKGGNSYEFETSFTLADHLLNRLKKRGYKTINSTNIK